MIDKPVGIGSTPVVSAVKRALREGGYAKVKVGHGGTLDPLASGVLPIALGEATKLAGRMLDADKEYSFTVRFGEETATLDAEGEVTARSEVRPIRRDVEVVLERFTGEQDQVPPAYSALKVDGRRAYDLARDGQSVDLAARRVTVKRLGMLSATPLRSEAGFPPYDDTDFSSAVRSHFARRRAAYAGKYERVCEATLTASVSKGTYIRSLARDIAHALGTVGHVTMLRRTRAGLFTMNGAISLDKLGELAKQHALEQALQPLTSALDDIPVLPVTPDQASALRQGRTIGTVAESGFAFAMQDAVPVAYVEIEDARMRVVRGFNL